MNYLITGGAGFIGSALCRLLAENAEDRVIVLDRLTYAGSMGSLRSLAGKPNFRFARGDIRNRSSSAACWPTNTSTPLSILPPRAMSTDPSTGPRWS